MADGEDNKADNDNAGGRQTAAKIDCNSSNFKILMKCLIYFACGLLGICIIIRLIRFGDSGNHLFFYIWTLYLCLFIAMLVVAILRVNKVLFYFRFLRTKQGIGIFMVFVGTLLFDWTEPVEFAIALMLIGVGGAYWAYGCKVGNPENEQLEEQPKEQAEKDKKKDGKKGEEMVQKFAEGAIENRMSRYRQGENVGEYAQDSVKAKTDAQKEAAKQNAAPPSYVPKGGGPTVYQQDTPISKQMEQPQAQAPASLNPNYDDEEDDYPPGGAGYGQNPAQNMGYQNQPPVYQNPPADYQNQQPMGHNQNMGMSPAGAGDQNYGQGNYPNQDQDEYYSDDDDDEQEYEDSYNEGYNNQNRFAGSPALQNDPMATGQNINMNQPANYGGQPQTKQWQPPNDGQDQQDVDNYLP